MRRIFVVGEILGTRAYYFQYLLVSRSERMIARTGSRKDGFDFLHSVKIVVGHHVDILL